MAQLGLSEKALLAETVEALGRLSYFFNKLNHDRMRDFMERFISPGKATKRLLASAGELREVADALEAVRDDFEKHRRLLVLSPLLDAEGEFDPNAMPHRYIYQAFSHQFALLELSRHVLRLLRKAELVTNDRKISRIWFPDLSYMRRLEAWMGGTGDDEDGHELGDSQMEADMAQMHAFDALELSAGAPRNPDALEPETFVQWTGQRVWTGTQWLFTSNRLFVWKAGFLTALVSLPLYYRASAAFCYEQKAVWASFMFQLTLSRWRGDTFYGTWVRVIATALGACFGGIMWYISSGSGQGNVWGMGVTTAVAFPMLYFFRQYSPFSPPLKLVCVVTAFLVLGYSWQDTHFPSPGVLTYGADIMWRRLVLVLIGLGAALVGSYLPPSHTLRVYQRKGHAACIAELTKLTSSVLTWGAIHPNPDRVPEDDPERVQLTKSLINLRSKIRRLQAISPNTAYEVSFLGRWPAERYKELNEALLDAVKNLTYAYNVLKLQPGPWARAQFKRMRLSDPRFVGDMFAVVHMASTSLGGGKPMPHITPAPLLDRLFTLKNGFDIVSSFDYEENEEIFTVLDLPQHLDRATLENIDYFLYAVGATSWTSFILRLDRIALAIKELCGEAYMVPLHVVEQPDVKSLFTKLEELRKMQRATELAIKKAQ